MNDSKPSLETQDLSKASVEAANHPQRIGRYRIQRLLGKGGFGLVYLAYDEHLDRPVAIKVPHVKLIAKQEDAELYAAEARTVANLDHPNIVPVHDVGTTDDFPFFVVSKYIDGSDLHTILKDSRPSHLQSAELVATVAEALHYAHKQGLVHRDIKPGNILLDKVGKPFVADFGLALRDQDVGKGSGYVGTPAYMSPEQACGEGQWVDGRSDIFSLGVVLYELLVGRRPFQGVLRTELLGQVVTQEPRPLRQYDDAIPKELEHICLKMLSKKITERYSTAMDAAVDLRHFLLKYQSGNMVSPLTGIRLGDADTPFGVNDTTATTPICNQLIDTNQTRNFVSHSTTLGMLSAAVLIAIIVVVLGWNFREPIRTNTVTNHDSSVDENGFGNQNALATEKSEISERVIVMVLDQSGEPLSDTNVMLIVGGYATDGERSLPAKPENELTAVTTQNGVVEFLHSGLTEMSRHVLHVHKDGYSSASRFPELTDADKRQIRVVLFGEKFVTLRYSFQPLESLSLTGEGLVEGQVKLYPMEGGSYRPPARAHFSFAENRRLGGGGFLKASMPGIEIDYVDGKLYFGGSRGRFDHCTDIGAVSYDSIVQVDTDMLDRKREDTEIVQGHVYIYESNIYEPKRRTDFTGHNVRYAKILVESIAAAEIAEKLVFQPSTPKTGRLRVQFRPGSSGLDGAVKITVFWAVYDADAKLCDVSSDANRSEFPSRANGTEGGDFTLGRKRCFNTPLRKDGEFWICDLDIPDNAVSLALLFVDELDRTSVGGIQTFPVSE